MLQHVRRLLRNKSKIIGCVDDYRSGVFRGWASRVEGPDDPIKVGIFHKGTLIRAVDANIYREDILNAGYGNGKRGFEIYYLLEDDLSSTDIELIARAEDGFNAEQSAVSSLRSKSTVRLPYGPAAQSELDNLNRSNRKLTTEYDNVVNLILFDIQDLLNFLQVHSSVTGIQRVVCGVMDVILNDERLESSNIVFCTISRFQGNVDLVQKSLLRKIVKEALSGKLEQSELRESVLKASESALRYKPKKGDTYFIGGAYWIVPDCGPRLNALKAEGVVIGTYIYDLIPITAPQWVTMETRAAVTERAIDIMLLSDFFLTISEFVMLEVNSLLEVEFGRTKPIDFVRLPHQFPLGDSSLGNQRAEIVDGEYVLCVCTLEGRKNHILLYRVWAALLRKYGKHAVPKLLLVGKWGWNIEDFRTICEKSSFLDSCIEVRANIGDRELQILYQSCLFTVFPSFVEGWGLPVGESLSFGKLCLASSASSIPEVGGVFCEYFDPNDFFATFKLVEKYLVDRELIRRGEMNIKNNFRALTWEDYTKGLLAKIIVMKDRVEDAASGEIVPKLEPNLVYNINNHYLVDNPLVNWNRKELKFIRNDGWHALESWGGWASSQTASIKLKLDLTAGKRSVIMIEMRLPPIATEALIKLSVGGLAPISMYNLHHEPQWLVFNLSEHQSDIVQLNIESTFQPYNDAGRLLYAGFSRIIYYSQDRDSMGVPAAVLRELGIMAYSQLS